MERETVCCVIVTHNRKDVLRRCLDAVFSQTRLPDAVVVVVDNASRDGTREFVKQNYPTVHLLSLSENTGFAGGTAEGFAAAYRFGFKWFWLLDDDALPSKDNLERLLEMAEKEKFDALSAVTVDSEDEQNLAYPFPMGWGLTYSRESLGKSPVIYGSLFYTSVLINRTVIERIGLPDKKLFIRGDEVDYVLRMRKGKLKIGVATNAIVKHPSTRNTVTFLLGGRWFVERTGNLLKDFYIYRNRAYIIQKYSNMKHLRLFFEVVRYTWFFWIIRRGDWMGWQMWFRAFLLGASGRLIAFEQACGKMLLEKLP